MTTAGMTPVEDLARELGLDPGDVRVMLHRYDPSLADEDMTNELGAAIRGELDQHCVRTVAGFWYPGSDPDAGKHATKMTFDHRRPTDPT